MKTFFVTLVIGFCVVAADVSHLPSSYLPPPKPEHAVSMSIEQQELRELPEQVEYMREMENSQMDMDRANMMGAMPMPSSLLTPPAPVEADAMLPTRYLPPAPVGQLQQQQMNPTAAPAPAAAQEEESSSQAAPIEPEPLMQPEAAAEQQMPMDYMQYLPPAPLQGDAQQQQQQQQQLTYQQYQEQFQQQQEQQPLQQEYQMPYILDVVQQPMAPSDAETLAAYEEPQPAHELRNDGYHYKSQAEEEQRLRH